MLAYRQGFYPIRPVSCRQIFKFELVERANLPAFDALDEVAGRLSGALSLENDEILGDFEWNCCLAGRERSLNSFAPRERNTPDGGST